MKYPSLIRIVVSYEDDQSREWIFHAPSLRHMRTFLPIAIEAPADSSFQEARAVLFDLRFYLKVVFGE